MDFNPKFPRENPYTKANIFSKVLFVWLIPFLREGKNKNLEVDDLYDVLKEDRAKQWGDALQREYSRGVKQSIEKRKRPILMSALWAIFGSKYLLSSIGIVVGEIAIRIFQPILLQQLIKSFEVSSTFSLKDQCILAAGLSLSSLGITLCYHPSAFFLYRISMRCRLALSSLIFRKVTRLSVSALYKTNVGAIVNLLSNDVNRFDQNLINCLYMPLGVIQLVVFSYLLWIEFGVGSMTGVGALLIIMPLQYYNGKLSAKFRLKIGQRTDERGRIMTEIISGIRIIKLYAWEIPFSTIIHNCRTREVAALKNRLNIRGAFLCLYSFASRFLVFVTILVFILQGHELTADKVFFTTAVYMQLVQIWMNMIPSGIAGMGEIMICIKRIQTFLELDEQSCVMKSALVTGKDCPKITLNSVSATWTSSESKSAITDVTCSFGGDKIVIIVGPCGSGKSSLLQVLLNELTTDAGTASVRGNMSYSSQEPWVFAGTIKQNILLERLYDPTKYQHCIQASALKDDLKQLPFGENTLVGERGLSLSGGQKARVSLARCLYQDADIYMLDDIFSAVDSRVSRHLFEHCIRIHLSGKLRILVTHQLQYLPQADHIIVLKDGKIFAQGKFEDLLKQKIDFVNLMTAEGDEARTSISEVASTQTSIRASLVTPEKFQNAVQEEKAIGSVDLGVYMKYFKMGRSPCILFFSVVLLLLCQLSFTGSSFFLSLWTNAENTRLGTGNDEDYLGRETYISIYASMMGLIVVSSILRSYLFFTYSTRIGINLHDSMFSSVIRAPVLFFDEHPSGRIMNRFTKDLGAMDELLSPALFDMLTIFCEMLGVIAVIIMSNYFLAPLAFVVFVVLWWIRRYYVRTSRDVKRIEGVTKSPLFTHTSSTLNGLTTIRASRLEAKLIEQFDSLQDVHTASWFLFFSSARCFGMCIEIVSVLFLTVVSFSFLLMQDSVQVGNVGLAISSAMSLSGMLQFGMRQSAEVENLMTSVERNLEYAHLPSEAPLESSEHSKPSKEWPENGALSLVNASMAYVPGEKDVIKQLTFDVQAREKVGIVGRTGAGKSSIIQAIFRLSELREGEIRVDGVNIAEIGLHDLRRAISIIPQDPVLFSGTMRYNLDPFNEYSDDHLWKTISEVELKNAIPALDCLVHDGGSNFSLGQRQLVCLARAILRQNKIIFMDEATASIDAATDMLIQRTIRDKFHDCTIIMIAHRLHSVMDCDKILVMENGCVKEYGHPHELLQGVGGSLAQMVKHVGKASEKVLRKISEDTYYGRRGSFQVETLSLLSVEFHNDVHEGNKL